VVGNIYVQRYKYPSLFQWYDEMKKEKVQGKAVNDYSMYQVVTAAEYTPIAYLLTIGPWTELERTASLFLMQTVSHFNELAKKDPKFKLTSLHWHGSKEQLKASSFVGEKGWGCSDPEGKSSGATLAERQQALIEKWSNSKSDENLWKDFYPDTTTPGGAADFLDIPAVQDLYQGSAADNDASDDACDPASSMGHMYRLYDGGLCGVAFWNTKANQSASELFSYYFIGSPSPRPQCGGAIAQGAVTGATGMGMMGVGLIPIVGSEGIAPIALGVACCVGAVGGGVTGAFASKDTCENK